MTKDEATTLFERVYETFSQSAHPCMISLMYYQVPIIDKRTWGVVIGESNGVMEWHLASEEDWQVFKTSKFFADAMRTQGNKP